MSGTLSRARLLIPLLLLLALTALLSTRAPYASHAAFLKSHCFQALADWAQEVSPEQVIPLRLLGQDLECLLRMYVPDRLLGTPLPRLTSPFQRLGLLMHLPDNGRPRQIGRYRVLSPPVEEVHPLVLLTALIEASGVGAFVPLRRVLHEPMQAGRTLTLPPTSLLALLKHLQREYPAWSPQRFHASGEEILHLRDVSALQVMQHYYEQPQ